MNTNAKLVRPVTGNSNLVRPRFSPGLLLRDDDLNQSVDYTRDLSRLLFRSLFGCGVVCGLVVKWVFSCGKLIVTVEAGVALDCHGDPIHVPEPQPITIDPTCGEKIPPKIWVMIRRTEKCCAPRTAACPSDDDETPAVCTRERDGFEIRIVSELPECACGCTKQKTGEQTGQQNPASAAGASPKSTKRAKVAAGTGGTVLSGGGGNDTTLSQSMQAGERCLFADPRLPCYEDHYLGKCNCECCDCEWVLLASLEDKSSAGQVAWKLDHSVRRFIRPVLACDAVAWREAHPAAPN
jgi:hypothetical protein